MAQTQDRIACPKCASNNFPGTQSCWQCNAPLPPPDALTRRKGISLNTTGQAPLAVPIAPARRPTAPAAGLSNRHFAIIAMAGLVVFAAALFLLRPRTEQALTTPPAVAPENRDAAPAADAPQSAAADSDPIVEESKRVIEHATRHMDNPAAPVSADGQVHLRHGGSISPDAWRDAQRHVDASPVTHQPLPPPPTP